MGRDEWSVAWFFFLVTSFYFYELYVKSREFCEKRTDELSSLAPFLFAVPILSWRESRGEELDCWAGVNASTCFD